ncbi:MAG: polymerase subunit epsilon [Candidatus Sumerlaeota bacterium]|nr:polymerase subunit epsilon [Candidatus Sumerlaeota bacterium]
MTPARPHYTIIDFETTQSSDGLRAVEVAIVRADGDGAVSSTSLLLNPGCRIDGISQSIHGIDNSMVRGQPCFADAWPGLLSLLDGQLLIAHNASFDAGVLRTELQRHGFNAPRVEWLCSCRMAKRLWPALGCHKLGYLAREFGLPGTNSHRAEADALLTQALVAHGLRELEAREPGKQPAEHLRAYARIALVKAWPFA